MIITFELDADTIWRTFDETAAERPKTLSIGEYGPRRGVPRILDLLERHGLRASWFVPGLTAENWPDAVRAITAAGHEVANHGDRHENFALLDTEQQRAVLLRSNRTLERISGSQPVGFRAPEGDITPQTPGLLAELGFRWSSTMRGDDRPSFQLAGGTPTDVVEIPMHWELSDFGQFMFNFQPAFPAGQCRIAGYADVLETWTSEFDAYYDLGLCYVLSLHPQTIGTPGRLDLLDELLSHIRSRAGVWVTTGAELADWWRDAGPPPQPGHPDEVAASSRRVRP